VKLVHLVGFIIKKMHLFKHLLSEEKPSSHLSSAKLWASFQGGRGGWVMWHMHMGYEEMHTGLGRETSRKETT